MKKTNRIHWYRFGQKKGSYLSRDITFSHYLPGGYLERVPHFGFTLHHYKHIDWIHYVDRNEMEATFRDMMRTIRRLKGIRPFYRFSLQTYNRIDRYTQQLNTRLDQTTSHGEFAVLFQQWSDIKAYADANVAIGNYLVRALSQEIERRARHYFPSLSDAVLKEKLMVLSYSDRETVFYRREKEMLQLACSVYTKKLFAKPYNVLPTIIKNAIERIKETYAWMSVMFLFYKPIDVRDLWNEVRELARKDPHAKLRELRRTQRKALQDRDTLLKKMKPDKTFRFFLRVLQESSWIESEVIRFFQMSDYRALPFLHTIAKRLRLSYQELIYLNREEIMRALRGGALPSKAIRQRRERAFGCCFDTKRNTLVFLETEKEIDRYREDRLDTTVTEIRGMVASSGMARGTAHIILDVASLSSFRDGEVLITTMTTPAFVVAMKKAVAIITNDGGITCHAAIVSRELGKPCVIATKNATEVFKDGDRVEVDAETGVVRKL